jgi:hypothetical protein
MPHSRKLRFARSCGSCKGRLRRCLPVGLYNIEAPAVGEPPLPEYRAPLAKTDGFPLTPTTVKTPLYCHSLHRNLAQLRRPKHDPVAELSHETGLHVRVAPLT